MHVCNSVVHVCEERASVSSGHGMGLGVGASSLGVRTCWADSTRPLSPRQGLPLLSPFTAPALHVHLARQEPCPLTWLRKPGPREGPRPVQGSEAPQAEGAGHPGSETAVLLHPLQDLLWAASFYSRFFLSYIPFYGVRGALLLFVAVRYGQGQSGRD